MGHGASRYVRRDNGDRTLQELSAEDRALVALVPDPLAQEVDKWRARYDPNYEIVPPHITVAYPPFVPDEDWEAVRPAVARFLDLLPPFTIHLRELGVFAGDYHYLWLKPEDDGALSRIRSLLEQSIPQYVPDLPYPYQAHVTIGVFESREALLTAQQCVMAKWKPCEFELNHLVYMSPDSRGLRCVCSRLHLGGTAVDA